MISHFPFARVYSICSMRANFASVLFPMQGLLNLNSIIMFVFEKAELFT